MNGDKKEKQLLVFLSNGFYDSSTIASSFPASFIYFYGCCAGGRKEKILSLFPSVVEGTLSP